MSTEYHVNSDTFSFGACEAELLATAAALAVAEGAEQLRLTTYRDGERPTHKDVRITNHLKRRCRRLRAASLALLAAIKQAGHAPPARWPLTPNETGRRGGVGPCPGGPSGRTTMLEFRVKSPGGSGGATSDETETVALWTAMLIEMGAPEVSIEQYDDALLDSQRTVRVDAPLARQARELLQAARTFWQSLRQAG